MLFLTGTLQPTIHQAPPACLPRQGFSAFSIRLLPHPFFHQTHSVRLPLQKQGNFPISNRRTLLVFFKLHFNHLATKYASPASTPAPTEHYPLNLSSPFILYSLKTLHFNHLAAKCVSTCPRPVRAYLNPQYTNSPSLPMLFLSPLTI